MNRPDYLHILRADEKTAAWLDHLETIGRPAAPVIVPAGDAFIATLHDLDVPGDDIGTMVRLRGEVVQDEKLTWLIEQGVHSLLLRMDVVGGPPLFPALPDAFGEMGRFFYAFVYAAMLPHTRALHRRRGIPETVTRATMADVGRHFLIHRDQKATHGMSGADWLMVHARGLLYQLGRLQFERAHLGNRTSQAIAAAGFPCAKGEPVISIHIPGHMGPMAPETCDAAVAEARIFFGTHYAEEMPRLALCHSWLLDEQLGEYLPATANIIRFQGRFQPAYRPEANNRPTLEFVFRTPDRPLDELPQRTTLERAVVQHIRDGRQWHGGVGWMEW